MGIPRRNNDSPPPPPPSIPPLTEPTYDPSLPCPFCHIATSFPPYSPLTPPSPSSPSLSPSLTGASNPPTHILLSTPLLIAFLDILPLSRGHLLLCPRRHSARLTGVTSAEARNLGRHLPLLSAALARATGVPDWNVVQNNGAAAAQVVHHTHFHVIPRPEVRAQGRFSSRFTMFGRGQREELDDDEAAALAARIRAELALVLREEVEEGGAYGNGDGDDGGGEDAAEGGKETCRRTNTGHDRDVDVDGDPLVRTGKAKL